MLDVLLINPPLSQRERYGKLAPFGNHLPNLGLAYLAAYLRERDVSVEILDAPVHERSVDKTARLVADKTPLIAGITATTVAIKNAGALGAKIKQYSPDTTVVMGGPHITALPQETMEAFRSIDCGVIGEGERTLHELFGVVENGGTPTKVPGLIFRHKGEIIRTAKRSLVEDLDFLPMPAWDLFPDLATHYRPSPQSIRRLPSTILFTSRGCPYRCTFCDRSIYGNKYRVTSPGRIFEMMDHLFRRFGIVDFAFHDELFLVKEKHIVELCQHIIRAGLPVSWSCQGRGDMPITDFGLRKMKEAGCWQVQFGVESGSNTMLRLMNKGVTARQIKETIARVHAIGIGVKGFLMIGFPGETLETIAETEEFILESELDDVMIGFFTPYPGTEVMEDLEQAGVIIGGYEERSAHFVTFVPRGLSKEEMIKARNRMYRKFYLRSQIIKKQLARLKEPSLRPILLRAAARFFWATK